MEQNEMKWYVVKTISGKEEKIKKYIQRELELNKMSKFVSQILIPTEKVYQIKNGKKVNKERNFFPGYILLEANLFAELIHLIRNLTGVITFLGGSRGGEPLPLRKQEVNRILGRVDELSLEDQEMSIPYVVGDSENVIDGPSNGFNATIEEINEEKRKLQVMVKIFGRKTPLELNYMQVDKI